MTLRTRELIEEAAKGFVAVIVFAVLIGVAASHFRQAKAADNNYVVQMETLKALNRIADSLKKMEQCR